MIRLALTVSSQCGILTMLVMLKAMLPLSYRLDMMQKDQSFPASSIPLAVWAEASPEAYGCHAQDTEPSRQ